MDNHLFEQLKNAPKELKDFILSMMVGTGVALNNVEQDHKARNITQGIEMTEQSFGNLLESFRDGVQNKKTQEYKERFYAILKQADVNAEKMTKHTYFSNQTEGFITEGRNKFQEKRLITEKLKIEEKLQHSIENRKFLINHDYIEKNQDPIFEYFIKIKGKHGTDLLDSVLNTMRVYDLNGTNKKIELILAPNDPRFFNQFTKLIEQRLYELVDIYSIQYYKNYETIFVSIDKYKDVDINFEESKIILTFIGKIV